MWDRDFLIPDLEPHFPEYFATRARLRRDVIAHDAQLRAAVDRVGKEFSVRAEVGNDDSSVRLQAAMALLHQCIRNTYGMRFETSQSGGYGYSYSAGGGGSSGGGPPSASILATWNAFQTYQPNAWFRSTCTELTTSADDLSERLKTLGDEAKKLAEVAMLTGECEYLAER